MDPEPKSITDTSFNKEQAKMLIKVRKMLEIRTTGIEGQAHQQHRSSSALLARRRCQGGGWQCFQLLGHILPALGASTGFCFLMTELT